MRFRKRHRASPPLAFEMLMLRALFIGLLSIHGSIHLLGFLKAHSLSSMWLIAAFGFLMSACLELASPRHWWMAGAPAVVASLIAIASSWEDARFGLIPNALILVPLILSLVDLR